MRFNSSAFVKSYLDSFDRTHRFSFGKGTTPLPSMRNISRMEDEFMNLFFPGHAEIENARTLEQIVSCHMEAAANILVDSIYLSFLYGSEDIGKKDAEERSKSIVAKLLDKLPEIRGDLKLDAISGYDGDPASKGIHEIILCYPGLRAISIHRIAHFLYEEGVPLVPRMMSEIIHSKTGIDIHPGAKIGTSFFIDHGTGVVIGETAVLGNNVKLYQGVTLGALSFPKDACGQLLRGTKRHPTIEDNVTIYANATILGDITIGENSTIAASAWITEDIPRNSRVMTVRPEITIKQKLPKEEVK